MYGHNTILCMYYVKVKLHQKNSHCLALYSCLIFTYCHMYIISVLILVVHCSISHFGYTYIRMATIQPTDNL